MATDDKTPTPPIDPQPAGEPEQGKSDNPATPARPRRIAVSTDPTMPIRLTGKGKVSPTPPPASGTPPPGGTPAAGDKKKPSGSDSLPIVIPDLDDDNGNWIGKEQTLVGAPVKPAAPAPAESDDEWMGREKTIVPVSKPASGAADDEALWLGQEKTMVGAPVPKGLGAGAPAGGNDEEWMGRDATVIGTPLPKGLGADKRGDTTSRGGTKKTNPTLDDGWHLKGRQGPLTGKTVGDYEVGGILGEGGMGTVYRARQISLKRRVALKVLPPNLANDVRLRERFEQEARTASLLNSPHVVQVFAAGSFEDMVYFVMEFVEGTDLSEKMREKNDAAQLFTPDEAAGYVIQAARGLAEAGKHNIVHRDIKPANLMITAKGVLKVADFGISKVAGEHGLTMTGTAVGTPAYCSPEQGRGDQVDARADLYSLGVVFYELLTGRKPFEGATANALIYQHNYAEPKLITDLRAEVPDAYQAVALKCLQKDPAKRYQDANELVADLERVRAGSAPMTALMSAFGTGADEAMRRLGIKQRKLWPYIVAALLIIAVTAGGVVWYTRRTSSQQTVIAEAGRLRTALAVLDKALPVPKGSDANLEKLARLVAKDDKDLVRWQAKLTRVLELQKRLARLDQVELPDFKLRTEATADLDRYKDDVGGSGEDVQRWQERLDAARDEIAIDREALAELDKTPVVPVAMAERLNPQLDKLATLVGDGDDDVKRWKGKLSEGRDRAGQLRARLAVLDDGKAKLTETVLKGLDIDLAALSGIVGTQDAAVQGWTAKLAAGHDALARLRKSLARLDAVEWATFGLQAALKPDLDGYTALVDANDPELKRWSRKFADSVARIANLRKTLSRLDQPAALSVDEQTFMNEQLGAFRALVSPDDGQLQAWSARLRAEQSAVAAMLEDLKRLDSPERLTVVELDTSTKALAALVKLGGIGENQQRLDERRLQEERQKLEDLRQLLRARESGEVVIDQELVDNINLLSRLAGEQDEDVKHWRGRVSDYERLRTALLPLDAAASVPEHADEDLVAYEKIVGRQSLEVRRWRAKLERIVALRKRLAPLDQVVPLPEGAQADSRALLAEVGAKDVEARRWADKVARVDALTAALDGELADAYILPAAAPKQSAELVSLVSLASEHVARLATRVAVLAGPGRPSWASEYQRDEYGLYAELTITGVTQRFRYCPAGTFLMGSPDSEPGRDKDETQVRVTLSRSFWLADSECTQGFWRAVVGQDGSRFPGLERPVERVSWDDCKAFCIKLSETVKGLRARLPTEAEWEYACRAGVSGPYVSYQGPVEAGKLETIAWFDQDTKSTHGVKARFCNRLGMFDMLGNVWEWCEDRYGTYSPTAITDPIGREQETRVARGGSWGDGPDKVRAANRLAVRQDMRTLYLGMRIAVGVDWPAGQEPGRIADSALPLAPVPVPAAAAKAAPAASTAPPADQTKK